MLHHTAQHACMQASVSWLYCMLHHLPSMQAGACIPPHVYFIPCTDTRLSCANPSIRAGPRRLPGRNAIASSLLRLLCAGRRLLGEADGALYMAFMGTKQRRDLVTNAQVLQEPVWPEDLVPDAQDASQVGMHTACWRL